MSDSDGLLLLQLDANITKLTDKLSKTNSALHDWGSKTQKTIDDANDHWSKLFGSADPAKALDNVFSRSRFAVIDAGSAKLRIFGSALEDLGPVGLGVAAAIAAIGLAVEGGIKAGEFAEQLENTSRDLKISTGDLQAWGHAFTVAGISAQQGQEGLKNFDAAFGRLQDGAAKGALAKYGALIFTPEELKTLQNANDALPILADRIKNFGAATQQAIEKAFEIQQLGPLLSKTGDGIRDLLTEAHSLGIVIDADLIAKAAAANEELKTAHEIISAQLTSAFATLTPEIAAAAMAIAEMIRGFGGFVHDIGDILGLLDPLIRKLEELTAGAGGLGHVIAESLNNALMGLPSAIHDALGALAQLGRAMVLKGQIQDLLAGKAVKGDDLPSDFPQHDSPAPNVSTPKKGPKNDTAARTDQAQETLDTAEKTAAQAFEGLTTNVDRLAAYQLAALNAETDAQLDKIEKQRAAIESDKGIDTATKKILSAKLTEAEWAVEAAADAKAEVIQRKAVADANAQDLAYRQEIVGQYDRIAADNATMATTLQQRRDIELRQLKLDQQLELQKAEEVRRLALEGDPSAANQSKQDAIVASVKDRQTADLAAKQKDLQGPIDKYMDSIQDLNTAFQNAEVQGVDQLSSGLADAIVNAQNLGDVAKKVFLQMAADMISAILKKDVFGPVLGGLGALIGLPGGAHAMGTDFAPGGLSLVGEKGPELVNLPRGSQVVPNNRLSSLGGGDYYDLRGSFLTSDLFAMIDQKVAAGSQVAYARSSYDLNKAMRPSRRLGS